MKPLDEESKIVSISLINHCIMYKFFMKYLFKIDNPPITPYVKSVIGGLLDIQLRIKP